MAASAIIVSSDSSNESVGSPPSRVILFGDIPTVIPSTYVISPETSAIAPVISSATLMVETTIVASPTGLCGLVPYSDSDSDLPDKMDSTEYITPLPATSPFVYTDSSEAFDSFDGPPSQDPYTITIARWRSRVLTDSVPSSTPVTGSLVPTRADLLPPHKRFRDLYSPETSMEEDTETDTTKTEDGRELDIVDGDDVRNHIEVDPRDNKEEFEASAGDTVVLGIDSRSVPMVDEEIVKPVGGDSSSSSGTKDGTVRSVEDIPVDLDGAIRDLSSHV
nr:hypothetical protein [Tanacetum cinerariifolium]